MKNLGIAGIVVGIAILVLGLLGILGSGTNLRGLMAAAVVVIAAGFILYSSRAARNVGLGPPH